METKRVELTGVTIATSYCPIRLERSPTEVQFSEPCPVCGCKRRRRLQPAFSSRKRRLVFDEVKTAEPLQLATFWVTSPYASSPIPPVNPTFDRKFGSLSQLLGEYFSPRPVLEYPV